MSVAELVPLKSVVTTPAAREVAVMGSESAVVDLCGRVSVALAQAARRGNPHELSSAWDLTQMIRDAAERRQLSEEAREMAAELVLRAERELARAIRAGQRAGTISLPGKQSIHSTKWNESPLPGPEAFAPKGVLYGQGSGAGMYALIDLTDDDTVFEQALDLARDEHRLSRSAVLRHLRDLTRRESEPAAPDEPGQPARKSSAERAAQIAALAAKALTSHQIAKALGLSRERVADIARRHGITIPADDVIGKTRRIDSNRIVAGTVAQVDGIDGLLDLVDYTVLDGDQLQGWIRSLSGAIRSLTTLKRNLEKEQTSRDER